MFADLAGQGRSSIATLHTHCRLSAEMENVVPALVAAVVTLGIEFFTKPSLEARQGAHHRGAPLREGCQKAFPRPVLPPWPPVGHPNIKWVNLIERWFKELTDRRPRSFTQLAR